MSTPEYLIKSVSEEWLTKIREQTQRNIAEKERQLTIEALIRDTTTPAPSQS